MSPKLADSAGRQGDAIDSRYHPSAAATPAAQQGLPDHWSFLLGEIALYSFIVLLLSGIYLALFFDPSMAEAVYNGVYDNRCAASRCRGPTRRRWTSRSRSAAACSIRQIHHWAALLFLAAMIVHMMRIFFTGAFRKPREVNWIIGVLLLILGMVEGFLGYSLPDDLLSGTGLRIASAIMLSIPVVGTWMHWALFGGDFPGDDHHPAVLLAAHPAHPGHHPGADRGARGAGLVPEAHPVPRPAAAPSTTSSACGSSRSFAAKAGGFFAIVVRHHRPDGRAVPDQPDLEPRARTTRPRSSAGAASPTST